MTADATREGTQQRPLDKIRRLSIAVARGPDAGKLVEPPAGAGASIGTAEDNDVVLGDRTVSRYHLEVEPSPSGILVRDLGSTNGTFVGAVKIREAVVPRGAQIRVGDTVLVLDGSEKDASPDESPALVGAAIPGMVFASASMREVAKRVRQIAAHATPVLVHGETGTGKELVARAVHELSPRSAGPFVVVDCASLPASLLEAELFGHEKGAFTGADRARAGAFERADKGTVFLDEIGELPLAAQGALLGVLERRRFRRVGGDREVTIDVRVVSATNRDLRSEVNQGTFRADLYFRLAGARIVLPPLRDRLEDVPHLVRHFATELTGQPDLPEETIAALAASKWPGNVRELRSAVERAIAFGPDDLAAMLDDAPAKAAPAANTKSSGPAPLPAPTRGPVERYRDAKAAAIDAFERGYLADLIARTDGNASEAARLAQMDRPYLLGLLRRYGLR